MSSMRLQKFLSSAGVCSRRRGEVYIRDGRVRVNGVLVTTPGAKVDPEQDRVTVDGRRVELEQKMVYIALNKPEGYVTSCRHPDEKTVVDLVDFPGRVYPVGRLDKDSTGLLLLTNDGRLHHRLCHPSFDHEKEYDVTVEKAMPGGALKKLSTGILLDGKKTRPARVKRISSKRFRIVLQEGRNRQIRRMVRKVGNRVTALKRIRVVQIRLGKLPKGAWRFLTKSEIETLEK